MKFSELIEKLGAIASNSSLTGNSANPDITGVAAIDEALPGSLSYINDPKFAAQLQTTQASALILPEDTALQARATEQEIPWVEASNPRLLFAKAIGLFYQPFKPAPAIHPTAVIDPTAQIGACVAIGAHVVIQAGVTIGDHVCIHPNVVVYPDAQIGDRTVLHANCVIHERSQIGADCVVHAGAVVGSEGFGFVPTAEGWFKMEQSGCAVLGEGVEIGCNSTVDRPAVGETRIGRNTKLDNMVHIGHDCHVGDACTMAAQSALAGGVEIGNHVVLEGQVGVANNVKIGDGAMASFKAGIHRSVAPKQSVSGYSAVDHKIYLKSSAIYSRLPEMHYALRRLQHLSNGQSQESATETKSGTN